MENRYGVNFTFVRDDTSQAFDYGDHDMYLYCDDIGKEVYASFSNKDNKVYDNYISCKYEVQANSTIYNLFSGILNSYTVDCFPKTIEDNSSYDSTISFEDFMNSNAFEKTLYIITEDEMSSNKQQDIADILYDNNLYSDATLVWCKNLSETKWNNFGSKECKVIYYGIEKGGE